MIPIGIKKNISKIPGLNFLSRRVFDYFMKKNYLIHTLKNGPAEGLVFPIELPDDKNILIGNYELEFTQALIDNFRERSVFYDIGGFKGYFSGLIAQMGAKEVHVFEPMPKNIERIKELLRLNPSLPIKLHEAAVSENVGNTLFEIMADDSMGKLDTSSFQKGIKQSTIEVDTISLDSIVFEEKLNTPNLIKVDVEGAEYSVLRGASKVIDTYRPVFLIEIHGYSVGRYCKDYLEGKNYSICVLETNQPPNFKMEKEVCHYICKPS